MSQSGCAITYWLPGVPVHNYNTTVFMLLSIETPMRNKINEPGPDSTA